MDAHELKDKTAIVLGVANHRSIAWGIAQELAQRGARLVLTYQGERFKGTLEKLVGEAGWKDVLLVPCDVSDDAQMDAFIERMQRVGVQVSLFIDPQERQVSQAKAVAADAIEINTGRYAEAGPATADDELARITEAARAGVESGLEVLAGHGLNYVNVIPIAHIREIVELNIGHSIVARASLVGMDRAVRDMVALLGR